MDDNTKTGSNSDISYCSNGCSFRLGMAAQPNVKKKYHEMCSCFLQSLSPYDCNRRGRGTAGGQEGSQALTEFTAAAARCMDVGIYYRYMYAC